MEKNSKSKSVIAILLAIILIILLVGAWAFARYTSTVSGTGTATVAKWSFKENGLGTLTRTDTVAITDIAEGKLAPGTKGTISASVDATGCEVGVDYTISVTDVQNKPTNLKFYKDEECTQPLSAVDGKYSVTGTIAVDEASKVVSAPIYWKWDYNSTADADIDKADTLNGEGKLTQEGEASDANRVMTFKVEAVGVQTNPAP